MRSTPLATRVLLLLVSALPAAACAARSPSWPARALPAAAPAPSGEVTALLERAEEAWRARAEPARLREAVARWEEAARSAPTADLSVRLARARVFLGESVYAFDKTQPALLVDTYDRAVKDAEVALALSSPEFHRRVRGGGDWGAALAHVGPEGVPALYWYAAALGRWAQASGPLKVWLNHDLVRATMARCLEVDPDYFHAGPHRYFGAYHALSPLGAGQDLDRSRGHFREATARAPGFLGNKVLMAQTYAVAARDKALFKRLLEEAVAVDVTADPDLAPEQALARRTAEELLRQTGSLF